MRQLTAQAQHDAKRREAGKIRLLVWTDPDAFDLLRSAAEQPNAVKQIDREEREIVRAQIVEQEAAALRRTIAKRLRTQLATTAINDLAQSGVIIEPVALSTAHLPQLEPRKDLSDPKPREATPPQSARTRTSGIDETKPRRKPSRTKDEKPPGKSRSGCG
ncbi:MAG: hypothetical protein OXE94_02030 [Aestuariivita sp.]|nr:hypothetical protein [Aestuariivita sp.]MCY4202171.1 hypothetical protein [Aestuariivita sp.]MCY4289607.1 hypothetical protein [Aestuariivita sp.]MCY4347446.1 hypothetical protein [Aestuariivita sp.]